MLKKVFEKVEFKNIPYENRGSIIRTFYIRTMKLLDENDSETKTIREFVDNEFLARAARELRKYISKIQPSVDLSYDYEDQRGNITTIDIPVGIQFFWPDASI